LAEVEKPDEDPEQKWRQQCELDHGRAALAEKRA
jgi:hypothetical protein